MVLNIVYEEQKSEEERTHTLFHVFDGKSFNLRVRSDTKIAADDLSLTLVYAERLAMIDNEEPPSEKMLTVRVVFTVLKITQTHKMIKCENMNRLNYLRITL